MPFLAQGETSQVTSTYTQSLQQLEQLLEALLKLLQAKKERTQEQEQAIDDQCAESVKTALEKHGQSLETESGDRRSVYVTEGYTLSADLNDATGMPIYTVEKAAQGAVLSFQDHPGDKGVVYFETESSLDDTQKTDLLKALQQELAQSREGLTAPKGLKGAAVVQQRLDQMGEMAPYGAKAVLIADRLLRDGGVDAVEGQLYAFNRQKNGSITVTDRQTKSPLFQMDRNGAIRASEAALSPQNRQNFNGMFNKLAEAQPVQVSAVVKKSSFEIGER